MGNSWTCPHCNRPTTITASDVSAATHVMKIESTYGHPLGLVSTFIVCPNPVCKRVTLPAELHTATWGFVDWQMVGRLQAWDLIPDSAAKVIPDYVPAAIRSDYVESCRILGLSPKASATLSRRCLQGMIRDSWGVKVKGGRLKDEIDAIQDKVALDVWDAIDAVRKIGNIGAHMESDVNLVVDVEPDEARQLLSLNELLFEEWYVQRYERQRRTTEVKAMAANKEAARLAARPDGDTKQA